ncbi:MAG TPA: hypothetical protein VGA20_08220 [Gemmatimonadales bacterium]
MTCEYLFRLPLLLSGILLLGPVTPAVGQQRLWSGTARVRAEVGLDDNPFLLKRGHKQELEQGLAVDALSGRFRDMERATDLVPRSTLEMGLEGPALGGRAFDVTAAVEYEANLYNPRRRHTELGLTIAQALRRDGRLRFDVEWRPSYFHRNYLRDAVDVSGDANITPEERRYDAGVSREVDLRLGYRHRLVKSTRERRVEVRAELELRYFDRVYDAPFAGRSRRGPGAGLDLTLGLGRRWTLGLDYTFQSLAADPTSEVMILDETAFSTDFNGNGNTIDVFARALVSVDRSRVEHEVALTLEGELSRAAVLEVAYGQRRRSFGSDQPYDVLNRDRGDSRNEVSAKVDMRLAPGLHLLVGARHAGQTTNRAGDPGSTGEETDYARNVVSAVLRYRF